TYRRVSVAIFALLLFGGFATLSAKAAPVRQAAALPFISFSQTAYTVTESVGAAVITVILDRPNLSSTVTVDYRTQDSGVGDAFAGADYTPVSGTLTIPPG